MKQIYTNNSISIDGKATGLSVIQKSSGTVVYTSKNNKYKEHKMPSSRYSLTHNDPFSGASGRSQFEADILALIRSL